MKKWLNIEYFSLQSIYWMEYCIINSFAVTFLLACGYPNTYIGMLLAVSNIFALILQPVLTKIHDLHPSLSATHILLLFALLISMSGTLVFFISPTSILLLFLYTFLLLLTNAGVPFLTAVQTDLDPTNQWIQYGLCRAGGSLFYALSSSVLGILVERISIRSIPAAIFLVGIIMTFVVVYILFRHPQIKKTSQQNQAIAIPLQQFLHENPIVLALGIVTFFLFYGQAFINNYCIHIVQRIGGDASTDRKSVV